MEHLFVNTNSGISMRLTIIVITTKLIYLLDISLSEGTKEIPIAIYNIIGIFINHTPVIFNTKFDLSTYHNNISNYE